MTSKHIAKLMLGAAVALLGLALLAPTAFARETAKGFERFAGCPSPEENPTVFICTSSVVVGGHFQMGSKDVPIKKPITLSGGIDEKANLFFNSKGGLAPVKEEVPGGVIGITGLDWLVNFLNAEQLKLYAVTELVGPATANVEEIKLPIRVHLVNPVLGSKCYVGSASNPISLDMITGITNPPPPNEPIEGVGVALSEGEPPGVILGKATYVDNSFAAPKASGCVLMLLGFLPISLDGLVNSQAGLPSPAGTNETRQEIELELAATPTVYP
jgi:hypothetical protein